MQRYIIGIDVGGTKVAGGLLNLKARLVKSEVVPTRAEEGFETSLGQIRGLIASLVGHAGGKDHVLGIGICAPGPLNPKTGLVINPPNLPGWRNIQLARRIEKEFKIPTKVENDANAAGLAEVLFGAAVGYRDIFYVTVSTGIGTGIIINKKIYHGKNGVARAATSRLIFAAPTAVAAARGAVSKRWRRGRRSRVARASGWSRSTPCPACCASSPRAISAGSLPR